MQFIIFPRIAYPIASLYIFLFNLLIVFETGMKLTEDNFDLVNEWRRGCRQGNETSFLEPSQSCKDQFTIGTKCFNHGTFALKISSLQ